MKCPNCGHWNKFPEEYMKKFKLEIELVPSTVWYSSLYQLLPRNEWYAIKKEIFTKEGRKCYICGSKEGSLTAHEFWEYDDERHIQRLIEIHHLCDLCHKIKHIGFWCHSSDGREKLEKQGLSREDLIKHFCKVNNCTEKEFSEHEDKAFEVWTERSKHQWKQDFGRYEKFIKHDTRRRSKE